MKIFSLVLAFIMQIMGIMELPFAEVNPVAPTDTKYGADPFIVEADGSTYYTYTDGGYSISINKTNSLEDLNPIEKKTVYRIGQDGIVGNIWAPEIHKIGDKWYIVACALFDKNKVQAGSMPKAKDFSGHDDYYRYGFVLESKTDDILGEYEFKAMIAPDNLNNIDGTYLQKDGKLYYVCSAYLRPAYQCICIAEMENPYTLKTDAQGKNNSVIVSKPTRSWEKNGWRVNEGPAVLYKGDKIYIVYSASGYSSGKYCMGMLTCTGNVMRKSAWIKSTAKVYGQKPSEEIYHPGHCCFVYKENGDIYMVYHATNNEVFSETRVTYIKKLEFIGDYPLFNVN